MPHIGIIKVGEIVCHKLFPDVLVLWIHFGLMVRMTGNKLGRLWMVLGDGWQTWIRR